jgi:hypothetical protein
MFRRFKSAILRELEVILMKVLIHKGGGERRNETVCGCVQLKDLSTEHIHRRSYMFRRLKVPSSGSSK